MPQDVFISYAKADAKKAARIAELLEERGVRCWIAPRDVKPGASYGDEIIRGIETSSAFLLVLSSASNESDFVAREVERAISKKKAVLPVRIENVEPSRALQLFISGHAMGRCLFRQARHPHGSACRALRRRIARA